MKKTSEVVALLRTNLAILGSIARDADLPALEFLIGMAELEATQAEVNARRKAFTRK